VDSEFVLKFEIFHDGTHALESFLKFLVVEEDSAVIAKDFLKNEIGKRILASSQMVLEEIDGFHHQLLVNWIFEAVESKELVAHLKHFDAIGVLWPGRPLIEVKQLEKWFVYLDIPHEFLEVRLDDLGNLLVVDAAEFKEIVDLVPLRVRDHLVDFLHELR
jgi:hypothetical protein